MQVTGCVRLRSPALVWGFNLMFSAPLKFRLSLPLFPAPFPCPALSSDGKACSEQMDVFGDHAPCCHNGTSLLFRHMEEAGMAAEEAHDKKVIKSLAVCEAEGIHFVRRNLSAFSGIWHRR